MGHHEGRAKLALYDTLAFSDAVGMADKMTSEDDTLIVTTADHAHVMSIAGYPSRGNPILGRVLRWCLCVKPCTFVEMAPCISLLIDRF